MSLDKLTALAAKAKQREGYVPPVPTGSTYPLDQIKEREQDTRALNETHVKDLAESIFALGLIESLALDCKGRLLAGGHRLAAIKQIQTENPEAFQKQFPGGAVPARVFEFDAEKEPDLALQIEVAENEKRRDYTSSEVKAIADRLREAGFADLKGRPKKGQKALMPMLSVIIGKSIRTVQNYLSEPDESDEEEKSSIQSATEKSTKRFVLLKKAEQVIEQLEKTTPTGGSADTKMRTQLLEWKQVIQDSIAESLDNP